jgi:GTP 3',8-cyclase
VTAVRPSDPLKGTQEIEVGQRIWLHRGGRPAVGMGILALLRGVVSTGSLHRAAGEMGMAYSKAWQSIRTAEETLGFPLLERQSGGRNGGGSTLAPGGEWLVGAFGALIDEASETMRSLGRKHLASIPASLLRPAADAGRVPAADTAAVGAPAEVALAPAAVAVPTTAAAAGTATIPEEPRAVATDTFGRKVDYLRISVTDRCNLRCVYCMPAVGVPWHERQEILSYEEIERFVRAAAREGITRLRLTGGEPLVRKGIVDLVRGLRAVPGIESVALTTNGSLLARSAGELAAAGVDRVNVSLVSLDLEVYREATRGGRLDDAMAGIDAAIAAGMEPVKVNVVVMRSLRQDPLAFARLAIDRPLHVRFIEYMPIGGEEECGPADGAALDWTAADRVPTDETLARLSEGGIAAGLGPLLPMDRGDGPAGWGPAKYLRFAGARGTIGFISPLSHMFCTDCNRLRLTADGKLRTCLFSDDELDARAVIRTGSEADLRKLVLAAIAAKPESHEMRIGTIRRMSQVGG